MIQVSIKWDSTNDWDCKMAQWIKNQLAKVGSWSVQLPPKDSIYSEVFTLEVGDKNETR
jgi:hypothetical protein